MDCKCNITERLKFNNYIFELLKAVKQRGKTAFLILVDLVGFSLINYTYGYDTGDMILIEVYNRLRRCLSEEDIIRNIYSDDFFIVLIGEERENRNKLNKISRIFDEVFDVEGVEIKIRPRIGVVVYPLDISNEREAVNHLFMFSKFIKAERGGGVFFLGEYSVKMLRNLGEIVSLLNKISLDNSLLVPAFQNIYDIRENRLYGCEILARIYYEGRIYPASYFMDVVDHFDFSQKLDAIILRKALQYKLKHGDRRIYFFNISPKFMERSLAIFSAILAEYIEMGLNPREICVEITESSEITEPYRVNALINNYKDELKVMFALDDFGVGYSNLAVFTSLNIDLLKIDRSLILQMNHNPKAVYLMKTFYELSLLENLMLLGEGVETEEQMRMLKKLNYDLVQGYYLHRPEVPEEFKHETS